MARLKGEKMKKKNINKPTNKDMIAEINFLGERLMSLTTVVSNMSKVLDLYITFRKQNKKFEKFIKEKAKEHNETKPK